MIQLEPTNKQKKKKKNRKTGLLGCFTSNLIYNGINLILNRLFQQQQQQQHQQQRSTDTNQHERQKQHSGMPQNLPTEKQLCVKQSFLLQNPTVNSTNVVKHLKCR